MNLMAVLSILMRFLHVLSAITLLGGVVAWRYAFLPSTGALAESVREKTGEAAANALRPVFYFAMAGILISGVFNFLNKTGLTPAYHAVFGIKVLLALHVLAAGALVVKAGNAKRARQLTGIAISGIVIVGLSAVLRWLSTH